MDVLSSIRRLVSEDRKAGIRPAPEDRLVLTRALRVVDPPAAAGEGGDEGHAWRRDAEAHREAAGEVVTLEDTIAELEAAVAGIETGFEPDGGEGDATEAAPMPDFGSAAEGAEPEEATVPGAEPPEELEAESPQDTDFEAPVAGRVPAEPGAAEREPWPLEAAAPAAMEYRGIMAGLDMMLPPDEPLDAPITGEAPISAAQHAGLDFRHSIAPRRVVPDPDRFDPFGALARPPAPEMVEDRIAVTRFASDWAEPEVAPAEATEVAEVAGEMVDEPEDHGRFTGADEDRAEDEAAGETPADEQQPDEVLVTSAAEAAAEASESATIAAAGDESAAFAAGVAAGGAAGRLHLGARGASRPLVFRPVASAGAPAGAEPSLDADADDGVTAADRAEDGDGDGNGNGDGGFFDPLADSEIDLDHLRDMVTEIIREELRGRLGERITRNLRLLVRREVERALEAERNERD